MKKFYTLLLVALLSLIGLSANAFTVTVKADPARIQSIQLGNNTDITNSEPYTIMEFSKEGKENTFDFSETYMYLKVVPVTTSDPYNAKLDCKDQPTKTLATNKKNSGVILIRGWGDYSGGTLEITMSELTKVNFNVFVMGDPSKFTFNLGQTTQTLVAGQNAMQCTENDYIMITPQGVTKLYQVQLNSREYQLIDNMGIGMYQINGSDVTEGATLLINTDFPDVSHSCTLACNDWDFITSVAVDGTALDPSAYQDKAFTVKEGQTLKVVGDKANYKVDKALANGLPLPGFGGQLEKVIEGDYNLSFEVTKLNRDKKFTIDYADDVEGGYTTSLAVYTSLAAGSKTEVAYSDVELPITVFAQTTSSTADSRVVYIYRNGEVVSAGPSYKLTEENLADGDVYRFELEYPTFNIDVTGAEYISATLYGEAVTLAEGANNFDVNYEAEDSKFVFSAVEGYYIATATVDGKNLQPKEGVYSFMPFAANNVVIVALPTSITINVNDAAGIMNMVLVNDDWDYVEIEDGENVIDMTEFAGGIQSILFGPDLELSYDITKVIFNGEDVTESAYVEEDGCYLIYPVVGGSVLDITAEKVNREDLLVVYVSGTENVRDPYIYNRWGAVDLGGELKEGYQNVLFNESYDCPLMCAYSMLNPGINAYCFYNNEQVVFDWGFNINATSYGVLKYYFQESEPEPVLDYIEVEGSNNPPIVYVDDVKEGEIYPILRGMETAYTHAELPGTLAVLSAPAGDTYEEVYFDGVLQTPTEEGTYVYYMTEPREIMIYANGTSAIQTIDADKANKADVYNLQGIKVNGQDLPAGFYVVNGKKVAKF